MKIVVFRSSRWLKQRYHFVLVAANGQTIATSENYVRRIDAIDAANRVAAAEFVVLDDT